MSEEKTIQRFWAKADRSQPCWLWSGGLSKEGSGIYQGKAAHRFSWELEHGSVPAGRYVLHEDWCSSLACVRPEHLRLATHSELLKRSYQRGNRKILRGALYPYTKLTQTQVDKIRLLLEGNLSQRKIARQFNVSRRLVQLIHAGKAW